MRILLPLALLAAAAGAADFSFPAAEEAEELLLASGDVHGKPEGVTWSPFVAAEAGWALAAARVSFGYYDEVYVAFYAPAEGAWKLAALDGPFLHNPEFGGDAGTIVEREVGDRRYYLFTCTESSYGSGMGTEYDYWILYRLADDGLVRAFDGETRLHEEFYSRWYGDYDSSAWAYGGTSDTKRDYLFDDVDGDGTPELWAVSRESYGVEGAPAYYEANLFAADGNGDYAQAELSRFADHLAASEDLPAKLVLAHAALAQEGNASAARAYLAAAAEADAEAAPGIASRLELLERLVGDPPGALRLFFAGGSDNFHTLIEQYPTSAAAAEAVVALGRREDRLAFLKQRRKHPRWPEAYAGAVLETLYDINYTPENPPGKADLKSLRKHVSRYLSATADAEERAGTLTHLADCHYHLGEEKKARALYAQSLEEAPEGLFADYNYLRLGDCAAAANRHGEAMAYYLECSAIGGWWGGDAEEALLGYAALRDGDTWRHFLDYLDERAPRDYLRLTAGDLTGDSHADAAVLVQWRDEPHELYFFAREGDEFRGELLARGRPALWGVEVTAVPSAGGGLLSCRETEETEEGRRGYDVFYRYDGEALREVARVRTEEKRTSDAVYAYGATVTLRLEPTPALVVEGTESTAEGETIIDETYEWSQEEFAFVRGAP
ncbi:MAG: tetratricopeptide repeat protein [Candidatus Coatesbacteria bacterium]|nr:MAG: tetratricopeptide repeat protein [Candidatus Coatesbacteria bacterium]